MSLFHKRSTSVRGLPWGTCYLLACALLLLAWCVGFGLWLFFAPAPGVLCC